jgi:diguanylate cyclase (GGDEF)-like protein
VRWRAGQVALGLAAAFTLLAFFRPLAAATSPYLKLAHAVGVGLGVTASALLASLKGRGRAESLALYAFLVLAVDALGQVVGPWGFPVWPLMAVLVSALTVAETLPVALGFAAQATLLALFEALRAPAFDARPPAAAAFAYAALVLTVNRALLGEKRRLSTTLAELARLKHGIGQLEDLEPGAAALRPNTAAHALRQVSEEGRRARQFERAAELGEGLSRLVAVAHAALGAHSVLYFDVDRQREQAYLRAAKGPTALGGSGGPAALVADCVVPLGTDPFAFVLDRAQSFYATDFKRLLWDLPWYRGEARVGSLLAVPVKTAEVIAGVLVADRLEIQSFTGGEPALLESFAGLVADAILRARVSLSREELDAEFKAVYPLSQKLATLSREAEVRELLLRSARNLVPLDGAAVVMADDLQTRYVVEECHGWAAEFAKREVGLSERTWAAWVLRSAEDPYLLDNVASHQDRMPILVLDEGGNRTESLLAVPLKARNRTLGALILTGPRGSFDAASHRVLGILANQAAATVSLIKDREQQKELAVRDGLTNLYNRRAFGELLAQAVAREDRQGGRLALILLDLDHFKKLNDTYGHPAGDEALRATARVLTQHLRKGDQAARYGGEEFVVILPGTEEEGALHLADRVREALHTHRLVFEGARIAISASLGAAVWPGDGKDPEALLGAADRALYASKQAGRNRVTAASRVPAAPNA